MSSKILHFFVYFLYTKKIIRVKAMEKEIAKKVGANLREARKLKGISQKEIAFELGKKQPEYSDYETGKIQLDYEKIVFLCKRLDITPNELFDLE